MKPRAPHERESGNRATPSSSVVALTVPRSVASPARTATEKATPRLRVGEPEAPTRRTAGAGSSGAPFEMDAGSAETSSTAAGASGAAFFELHADSAALTASVNEMRTSLIDFPPGTR